MSGAIRPRAAGTYSRILSVGAYRPARIVTNAEIVEHIDSSDEWIRDRSGIATRRFAAADETVGDMALAAAGKALANAGVDAGQVGAVILATVTHPYQTPSAAVDVAYRLGATSAGAFDLSAACAGFCYGMGLADAMVRGGGSPYVLVIGCEKLSDFVDPTDRSSAFIFGDGAGAVLVGPSDQPGIGPTLWGADGSALEAITNKHSYVAWHQDETLGWPYLTMQGQRVFRWAVWQMAPVAAQALEAAGLTVSDLEAFIPHQANLRIVDAMAKALKLPPEVAVARDIVDMGNTSAASVPLAMERMLESGQAKSGDTALLIGFGAGLAYAAQVVTLP